MDSRILQKLRLEYESEELDESSVHPDPLIQFEQWFNQALEAELPEPNAMTLATCNVDFKPSARIVLLKGIEEGEFIFYTNYNSRKGKELLWNPYATLLFFWNELHRQVRIEGRVTRGSLEESDAYFSSRPPGNQLGGYVSPQSEVVPDRQWLNSRMEAAEKEFAGKKVPRPQHWGSYHVIPAMLEFWQGRNNRLHDRLRYILMNGNEWKVERLAP